MSIASSLKSKITNNLVRSGATAIGAFALVAVGSDYYDLKAQENDKNNRIEDAAAFIETLTDPESWDDIARAPESSFDEIVDFYRNERARNAGLANKIHIISDGERTSVLIIGKDRDFLRYESAAIPIPSADVSKAIHVKTGYNAPFDNEYETIISNEDGTISLNPEERKGVAIVTLKQEYVPENAIASFGVSFGNSDTNTLDFGVTHCVSKVRLASMTCSLKQ